MGMWIQNYITRAFKPPCDISITFSDARTMKQVQCLYPHVAASWVSHRRYICNLLPPLSLFWNRCTTYLLSHWDIHIHYICFRFLAPSKFCHLWIVKISELYVGERNLCKDPQIRRLCCQFLYTMTYCNNEIWNSIFWCSEVRVSWFFTFLLSYDIKLREYLTTYSLSGTSLWFCWADMSVYSMCSTNKK